MSNIYSEILIIITLFLLLSFILHKTKLSRALKLCFYITYIISCVIVLLSTNGALFFTDGVDYLNNAKIILNSHGYNPMVFLDIQPFISIGDSWHFIPNYEFALFIFIFNSTKCISIFHIFLMQISILMWYLIFIKLINIRISKIFMILMLCSLYLHTFTISALKDPIVFFLVAVISYELCYLTKENYTKNIIILCAAVILLLFTRIYASIAMLVTIFIFFIFKIKPSKKDFTKSLLIFGLSFCILLIIPIFRDLITYLFLKTWELLINQNIIDFTVQFFIKLFNLYFSPVIINIFNAQYLYFGCYIESLIRTILFPVFLVGFNKLFKLKQRNEILIILFIPIFINLFSLTLGEQSSPVRQYMWNYQAIVIILSLGINEILHKNKIGGFIHEKCMCCYNGKT